MGRQQKIDWFINTLGLKKINARHGTSNCGHCALRLDTYIAQGETNGPVLPVPKKAADLFTLPTLDEDQIKRSWIEDPRVLERAKIPALNSETFVVYDITNQNGDPVLDLTFEDNLERKQSRIKLTRAQKDITLEEQLRDCPRRAKDGTAYGFIFLTHKSVNIGHVINYYVDSAENNNEVYFLDAQLGSVVDEDFISNYHPDVFYLPSYPPEGFKIKSALEENIQVKQEKTPYTTTENEKFIDNVLDAVKRRDSQALKKLALQKSFFFMRNSQLLNAMNLLASRNEENALEDCLWFSKYGGFLLCAVSGAAFTGQSALMEALLEKMTHSNPPLQIDYNQIASFAARGGQEPLMYALIKYISESNKPAINYPLILKAAAEGGQESLINNMKLRMRESNLPVVDDNTLAAAAAHGGNYGLMHNFIKNMNESDPPVKVNYMHIARRAALGGQPNFTLIEYMNESDPPVIVDLSLLAAAAGQGGHLILMQAFINQMIKGQLPINYNLIAGSLVQSGLWEPMNKMIAAMNSSTPPIPVNYNKIAAAAAFGGQEIWVYALIKKMVEAKPPVNVDYPLIIANAMGAGYRYLADKLKTHNPPKPASEDNDKRQITDVNNTKSQPGKRKKIAPSSLGPGLFNQDLTSRNTSEVEQLKHELASAHRIIQNQILVSQAQLLQIKGQEQQIKGQEQQIKGQEQQIVGLKYQLKDLNQRNSLLTTELDEIKGHRQSNTPGNG